MAATKQQPRGSGSAPFFAAKKMGIFSTLYMFAGISFLTLASFGLCSATRLIFGHRAAKRLHEIILGYGVYYWMAFPGYWRLKVQGRLPLPGQSYIIVSNHAMDEIGLGFMDHCLISFVPLPKKYLTKRQYFTLPFFGWTQWIVGDVGVDVSSKASRERSLEECRQLLRNGDSVVIYPEGTRTPHPPTLRPFKEGAFRMAAECGVPILPVALENTHQAMRRGMVAGNADMILHIGEPIYVENVEDVAAKSQQVHHWMTQTLTKRITGAEKMAITDSEKNEEKVQREEEEEDKKLKPAETIKPAEKSVKPAEESVKPAEESVKPAEESVKPTEKPEKPAEKRTEEPSQRKKEVTETQREPLPAHVDNVTLVHTADDSGAHNRTQYHYEEGIRLPRVHEKRVEGVSFADALKLNLTDGVKQQMAKPKEVDVPETFFEYPDGSPRGQNHVAPHLETSFTDLNVAN